ncbi:hypothetical protein [Pseudomonas sp. D1-2]|uniref:hypothetical protein n=1 Tax=unclassified Pseudomonas TaxID=196821 RepID=UPI003DA84C0B
MTQRSIDLRLEVRRDQIHQQPLVNFLLVVDAVGVLTRFRSDTNTQAISLRTSGFHVVAFAAIGAIGAIGAIRR